MNPYIALGTLLVLATMAGCHSTLAEESVPLSSVLASPYALRLSVSPQSARPGDHVTVSIEFENIGTTTLWIPRARETCIWYEQASGAGGGSLPPSACDGLRHVKVSPGKKARYEKDFVVPPLYGELQIYLSEKRNIRVSLEVKKEPIQPPQQQRP